MGDDIQIVEDLVVRDLDFISRIAIILEISIFDSQVDFEDDVSRGIGITDGIFLVVAFVVGNKDSIEEKLSEIVANDSIIVALETIIGNLVIKGMDLNIPQQISEGIQVVVRVGGVIINSKERGIK